METAVARIEADLEHLLSALDARRWKPVCGGVFERMAHVNAGLVEVSAILADKGVSFERLAVREQHLAGAELSLRRLASELASMMHSYSLALESAPVAATRST